MIHNLENLSPIGAAKLIGVAETTLASWRTRPPKGGGPVFCKIGRLIRYRLTDLESFVESRRRTSTSDAGAARP